MLGNPNTPQGERSLEDSREKGMGGGWISCGKGWEQKVLF